MLNQVFKLYYIILIPETLKKESKFSILLMQKIVLKKDEKSLRYMNLTCEFSTKDKVFIVGLIFINIKTAFSKDNA